MAHITLFFESSCVAHVSVNWLSPIKIRQTFIGGSRKMIVYDDVEPTEKIKVYDKGITLNGSPEKAHQLRIGYRAGDMWAPHIPAKEALQTEVEHFVDCIRNGKLPISSGLSGLKVVQILEAASRSIREQGKPIRLKPMRLKPMAAWSGEGMMIADKVHTKTHRTAKSGTRIVRAIHGLRKVEPDPQFELDMAAHLKEQLTREQLLEAFSDHGHGTNPIDVIMRRVCLRALVKRAWRRCKHTQERVCYSSRDIRDRRRRFRR